MGIIFAKFVNLSLVTLLSLVSLVSYTLKKQILSYSAFFLSIFFIGSLLYQNSLQLPSNHIAQFSHDKSELVLLKGLIVNDPINTIARHKTPKSSFILEARELKQDSNWQKVKGKVKVTIYGHEINLRPSVLYGDLLILEGKLSKPHLPTNPGQFNYREYLVRQRIHSVFTIQKSHCVQLIDSNQGNFIMQDVLRLKHKFKDIIYKTIPEKEDIIRQKYHHLKKYLVKSVSVSFAAWIGIMPLILYYFNIFSPVTILANLIVVPIMFVVILLALTLLLCGDIREEAVENLILSYGKELKEE